MLQHYKKAQLKRKAILFPLALMVIFSGVFLSISSLRQQADTVIAQSTCGDVYSPLASWITQRVNENKRFYIQVAEESGVPWEVLAAVHYREFNLRRDINPSNDQGIYQMYSIYQSNPTYRALAQSSNVSDQNFLEQTRFAADFIQEKARSTTGTPLISARKLTTNEQSINLIKSTLFSYNGRASSYAKQAELYGYSALNQPFEGSPYVMNKFDCQRSGMKLITTDGSNTPTATDTRLGAFTLYARLKGDPYWLGLAKSPPQECTESKVNCVWEFVNEDTGRYFYTSSKAERDAVYRMNYRPVGVSFHTRKVNDQNSSNVFRLYNNKLGWHFWTTNANEKTQLVGSGDWNDEGVGFVVDPPIANTGDPVRRLYNPIRGVHRLTTNSSTITQLKSEGYLDEGVQFTSVSTAYQAPIPSPGKANIYRFSLRNGKHFWTASIIERNQLTRAGETFEGVTWESSLSKLDTPVYRAYSNDGNHFWTTNKVEFDSLIAKGWKNEGIGWYVANQAQDSASQTYRFYNLRSGRHFYTTSLHEKEVVQKDISWRYEGIAWYN